MRKRDEFRGCWHDLNVEHSEPMSAAKLACILISVILLNAFGLWSVCASKHLAIHHWWLIWTLLLAILYASYGARYEQALWYPYDIPHLVIFGLGTVLILSNRPGPFVPVFAIDGLIRETSVFLIVVALLVHLGSKAWRIAIAVCVFFWILSRIIAQHLYPTGTHSWNGLHWYMMIKPWHLPQVFSITGFLWLPIWLGSKYLTRSELLALYGASAMILLTFFFATWKPWSRIRQEYHSGLKLSSLCSQAHELIHLRGRVAYRKVIAKWREARFSGTILKGHLTSFR
jgi:hypothetical protein